MQLLLKQEKSKYYLIINYFSTIKWKSAVDEVASFLDGGKIPCILVENKIDLLKDRNENDLNLSVLLKKMDSVDVLEHQLKPVRIFLI